MRRRKKTKRRLRKQKVDMHPDYFSEQYRSFKNWFRRKYDKYGLRKKMIAPVDFYDKIPSPKKDLAICTIGANEFAKKQLDITREHIISYAKKCNADYVELNGDQCPEMPMYNKWRLSQITARYKKTLYLDVDVVVKPNAPNLFEITPDDKISAFDEYPVVNTSQNLALDMLSENKSLRRLAANFLAERDVVGLHYSSVPSHAWCINGGVLMIPRGLRKLYTQPKKPYPCLWCFDQHLLSTKLNRSNFNKLHSKWNWGYVGAKFWQGLDSAYFIHVNGSRPDEYRLELLTRLCEGNLAMFLPPDPTASAEPESHADHWRPTWWHVNKKITNMCNYDGDCL
jgi:hypothetical protein